MFKRWNDGIKGIHIIQHFPISESKQLGEQVFTDLLGKLDNPVVAIINIKSNPSHEYSHVVDRTNRQNMDRTIMMQKVLRKYPQTEQIVIEGGENIILYSSQPFK